MKYVIGIGSNSRNAFVNVSRAIAYLGGIFDSSCSSSVYSTPSTKNDGTFYTNAVVIGDSNLDLENLNFLLKRYESDSGRKHDGSGVVEIDLDIVIAGEEIVRPKDYSRDYFTIGFKELL